MHFKDFRIGFRQLVSEPAYSAVVILGLAIAIASCYLIGAYLVDKLLPDASVQDSSRVVQFNFKGNIPGRNDDWFAGTPFVIRDAILQNKGPVVAVARVLVNKTSVRVGKEVYAVDLAVADQDIVDVFSLKAIAGDLKATLASHDGIALSTKSAQRLFGSADAMGKQFLVNGHTYKVTAILPPQAGNSAAQFDGLANFESPINGLPDDFRKQWYLIAGEVWARLAPGATSTQLGDFAQHLFDENGTKGIPPEWYANGRKAAFLRTVSLDRLELEGVDGARKRLLYGSLGAVALCILVLASINYVNLTTVRTLRRQREIGIRKSLGVSPMRLATQFTSESVLVALLAGCAGLLLAWLLAPAFADLLDHHFDTRLFSAGKLLGLGLGCVVLGVITGIYPARVAIGVNCAESLAGRSHSENASGRWLRRAMTTLQFAAAITLSAVAVVIVWQSRYASHIDYGFQSHGLVAVDMPFTANPDVAQAFHDAVAVQSGVLGVTWSSDVPGRNPVGMVEALKSVSGGDVSTRVTLIEPKYFETYGIKVLAGTVKAVSDDPNIKPVVVDRTAALALGFATPEEAVGKTIRSENKSKQIVAVTERVRQESVRLEAAAQMFSFTTTDKSTLTVRGVDAAAARDAINKVWPHYFPNDVTSVDVLDDVLARNYQEDDHIGSLIGGASVAALMLAGFGVYALAAYTVRRKTREIVIRKLYGANHGAIARLLVREFALLFAVGAAIGLPLAWVASQFYLGGFVVQAPIGVWPLVAAIAAALLMATIATLRHTIAALDIRPTLALQG